MRMTFAWQAVQAGRLRTYCLTLFLELKMFFTNLKIGARLGLAFAAVLLLTVILTFIGVQRLQNVGHAKDEMDFFIKAARLSERWYAGNATTSVMIEAKLRSAERADDEAGRAAVRGSETGSIVEKPAPAGFLFLLCVSVLFYCS
jgi:hypothetical protein